MKAEREIKDLDRGGRAVVIFGQELRCLGGELPGHIPVGVLPQSQNIVI